MIPVVQLRVSSFSKKAGRNKSNLLMLSLFNYLKAVRYQKAERNADKSGEPFPGKSGVGQLSPSQNTEHYSKEETFESFLHEDKPLTHI